MASPLKDNWDGSALYNMYIKDIQRYPLMTRAEERAVLDQLAKGSEAAKRKLVVSNLRFVVNVAFLYRNQGLSLPELINEGNIGLVEAANRFDTTRDLKFISYAEAEASSWWSLLQPVSRELSRFVLMKSTAAATPLPSLSPRPKDRGLDDAKPDKSTKGVRSANAHVETSRRVDLFSISDDDEEEHTATTAQRMESPPPFSLTVHEEVESEHNDKVLNMISNNFDTISQKLSGINTRADLVQVTKALFKVSSLISTGVPESWSATSETVGAAKSQLAQIEKKILSLENIRRGKECEAKRSKISSDHRNVSSDEEVKKSNNNKDFFILREKLELSERLQRRAKLQSNLRENFEALSTVERVIVENAQKLVVLLSQRNKMVKDYVADEALKREQFLSEMNLSPLVQSDKSRVGGFESEMSANSTRMTLAKERRRAQRDLEKAERRESREETRIAKRNLRKAKKTADHAEEDYNIALSIKRDVYDPLAKFIRRQQMILSGAHNNNNNDDDNGCDKHEFDQGSSNGGRGKQDSLKLNADNAISSRQLQRDHQPEPSISPTSFSLNYLGGAGKKALKQRSDTDIKPTASNGSTAASFSGEFTRKPTGIFCEPKLFIPVTQSMSSSSPQCDQNDRRVGGLRSASIVSELSLMERTVCPSRDHHAPRTQDTDDKGRDEKRATKPTKSQEWSDDGPSTFHTTMKSPRDGAHVGGGVRTSLLSTLKQWDTANPRKSLNFD